MTIENESNKIDNIEYKKRNFLKNFSELRNNYLEDIPDEILQPEMPDYDRYKCRKAFFGRIASRAIRMQSEGIKLSGHAKEKYEEFNAYIETLRQANERITKNDIDKANVMLDILINELS